MIDTYVYIFFQEYMYNSILFESSIIISLKTLTILYNYIKTSIFFKQIFIFYFNFFITNFGQILNFY